ncbi:MAG: hypothetical protein KDB03_11820 [Planctomycetales bacterium]|nr:hypothetical protein [Planctomycetales bacterium]
MPISRDQRLVRRRRVLRDRSDSSERTPRFTDKQTPDESGSSTKRVAGYSQDVRSICGHRLVQLIPVRRRSFAAVLALSLLLPAILSCLHYWIYVRGWGYGHPLSIMLDASHPRSLAAWLESHLWTFCLVATVLIFQLRRHKLDDYNGDYRLWFWLVATCIIGSLDATTRVTDMFALSLDRQCKVQLGWSGTAVVQSTLACLIGMLGLRLCSELKSVPASLFFMLAGLGLWATSLALSQAEFHLNINEPQRFWLRASTWLFGLNCFWLAALTYLRSVYIDAQRRFLLRGKLATSLSMPIRERVARALPSLPSLGLGRAAESDETEKSSRLRHSKGNTSTSPERTSLEGGRWRLRRSATDAKLLKQETSTQPVAEVTASKSIADESKATNQASAPQSRLSKLLRRDSGATTKSNEQASETQTSTRSLKQWLGRPKFDENAEEFAKVKKTAAPENAQASKENRSIPESPTRKWRLPSIQNLKKIRLPKPAMFKVQTRKADLDGSSENSQRQVRKLSLPKIPKPRLPKLGLPSFRLPKLKIPSLRLPPPEDSGTPTEHGSGQSIRPVNAQMKLPSTSDQRGGSPTTTADYNDHTDSSNRQLSKAERKRLRRQQHMNDRRAA